MAATLTQDRFSGPDWIFERKFDGIRLLAYKKGPKVELFSRNRLPQNIPALARAIAKLPHRELILDGEIDWHALTDSPLRSRGGVRGGVDARSSNLSPQPPLRVRRGGELASGPAYHVFDILWLDGQDVTKLALEERQALMKKLPLKPPLHRVTLLKDDLPWERAQREGWEGVIAKRRGSIYESRRSPNWLKMKVELAQEFVVGGFTDPQGKRVGLGALLVGYYERGSSPSVSEGSGAQPDFIYAGRVGTGFNTEMLLDLRAQLDKLEIPKPPFTKAVGLPRPLGPPQDRCPGWIHPMDWARQAAPSQTVRRPN